MTFVVGHPPCFGPPSQPDAREVPFPPLASGIMRCRWAIDRLRRFAPRDRGESRKVAVPRRKGHRWCDEEVVLELLGVRWAVRWTWAMWWHARVRACSRRDRP